MSNEPLYHDPALALFYDLPNRARPDFDYCTKLAREAASVLDLGCGTGELAAALAEERAVTGVDPAAAMLEIARARPGGERVTWHQGDARSVRLGRRFDLIILTGHAFQVFLTSEDQQAALATIAAHLAPDGRFVFDTRNPACRLWETRNRHNTRRDLHHPQLGQIEMWSESTYDENCCVLTYTNSFLVKTTGQVCSASSRIRYTPQEDLAAMLERAGLSVDAWLGDWHGTPFQPDAREIIPIGYLA
ncbi:MAG: class I SAM-dependent methyltransferase [Pseudomonadota bacterium]